MTLYLNFRSQPVGGSVVDPRLLRGDGTASPLALAAVDPSEIDALVAGKNLLFYAHGFNVSFEHGASSLAQFEPQLGMTSQDLFIGVLWPGDFWLPVVNYPFEGDDAIDCGKRLAEFCARRLAGAQSLSFASHSLGARLVLEAVRNLERPAQLVCLTAAAINRDCLDTEYAAAADNASAISILASRHDRVLQVGFRIGDPISIFLHNDHTAFQTALGFDGPPVPARQPISSPWQIASGDDYGHSDYLPSSNIAQSAAANAKWLKPAGFVSRAFRRAVQPWP